MRLNMAWYMARVSLRLSDTPPPKNPLSTPLPPGRIVPLAEIVNLNMVCGLMLLPVDTLLLTKGVEVVVSENH